jgi:succinate dehydrogenase / fumarate reductase cytochrome b subunit
MNIVLRLIKSSLGKKFLMAVSGIALFLFAIGHMAGNLQVFLGPDALNRYGHFLQTTPEILWPARLGLIVAVLVHLGTAAALTIENQRARAKDYEVKEVVAASYASRTMVFSGLIVFAFVVYHLLHFTVQSIDPSYRQLHDEAHRHDVYRMVVTGFSNAWVAGFYIVAVGLLCFHLSHGISAMLQSLGIKNEVNACAIDCGAKIIALALFLGYAAVPVSVLLGVVK